MARQRRGGFKPPELRGTLGTLLRTAVSQAGVVRDALERGARQGREKLGDLRGDRRRQEALAELGEIVLELIRKGEIDLGELPEARDLVRRLDELDDGGGDAEPEESAPIPPPRSRRRFDDRDDGTVSSSAKLSPTRKAAPKVWRPPVDEEPAPSAAPPESPRRALPRDPLRKGGIAFDDDDGDLADYMHPDDVPPKRDE